jgi:hypothetical protein
MLALVHIKNKAVYVSREIDLSEYNLIYFRRVDRRKFLVRHITKMNWRLIDSVTGDILDMTESKAKPRFVPDKKTNRLNKKKRPFMNFGKKRVV